jgi:hypothetical protein
MKLEIQSQDRTVIHASIDGFCCITQYPFDKPPVTVEFSINQIEELCRMLHLVMIKAVANKKGICEWRGEK